MVKNSLKIPPRSILIIHPNNKIMILIFNKKLFGFYYDEKYKLFDTTKIKDNEDPEKAIHEYLLKVTANEYDNDITIKDIANQRATTIIKELKIAIEDRLNHGHTRKANEIQTATIKDFLKEHGVKDDKISLIFRKVKIVESGTERTLREQKERKAIERKNKAKLESFKQEVSNNYNGNYIDYAMDKSKYLILNESKNIAKQILMSFMVIIKSQSLFNEIHGRADSGKSYIFKVSLDNYIPDEYVIELNSSTLASFINKCKEDPRYYDGKIIYIGDLGDKETYERMKQIFNVLKIVISEGNYKDSKNQQIGNEWKPLDIEIIGKIGAFYCSVFEDNEDKTKQLDSRAISSTPALNNPNEKILFKENVKIMGTVENAYYTKTTEELKVFREYFKESVIKYDKNIHMVINPFLMVFNEITKHRLTETRELENMNEMFKSYLILNQKRCFISNKTVHNEKIVYIIPKIEDVQKFINI